MKRLAFSVQRSAFRKCFFLSAIRSTLRAKTGFSLIEMLVAIMILSTGLLLVIEGMARSQHGIRVSENMIESSRVMEEVFIEAQIKQRLYDELPGGSNSGEAANSGRPFKWREKTDAYVHPTVKDETKINQVDVSVTWTESGKGTEVSSTMLLLNREKKISV